MYKFPFSYRTTPQGTTGISPAELLLGRSPRTQLDLLRPKAPERVEGKQQQQKMKHDARAKSHTFHEGEAVFVKSMAT